MIYKPPQSIALRNRRFKDIFLGGTIEMGKSEDWQKKIEDALQVYPCNILNPRRDDWNSEWKQEIENAQFQQQVEWELNALENSDWIVMNFLPGTQSPISLLELGLHAKSDKLLVCCPDGFWRKGNVDIICQRYDIRQFKDIENIIDFLKRDLIGK
jgi:hypothetical protein